MGDWVTKREEDAGFVKLASGSAGGVTDSTGAAIYPDNYAHTLTYGADGVATDAFTDGTNTWTQTFTYTSGNLTSISKWVKS